MNPTNPEMFCANIWLELASGFGEVNNCKVFYSDDLKLKTNSTNALRCLLKSQAIVNEIHYMNWKKEGLVLNLIKGVCGRITTIESGLPDNIRLLHNLIIYHPPDLSVIFF